MNEKEEYLNKACGLCFLKELVSRTSSNQYGILYDPVTGTLKC